MYKAETHTFAHEEEEGMMPSHSQKDRSIHLRMARQDDFEAVAVLFEALHRYNASLNARFALAPGWRSFFAERFQRSGQSTNTLWLLAWANTTPVGLLILEPHQGSPLFSHHCRIELVALYVTPQMRGNGLAHRLMREAMIWARAQGEHNLHLYVTAHNERARAFYRTCGGQPVQEIWQFDLSASTASSERNEEVHWGESAN
jgi:GNAT superfamily N-acetyltransferase